MAYTYYWNAEELERQAEGLNDGVHTPLDYTGGSGFEKAHISAGATLYVLNWNEGELRVLGRMEVGALVDRAQVERELGGAYDAPEHLKAKPGTATPIVLDATVPPDLLDDIVFIPANGEPTGPKRNPKGQIEPQTFRNVRRVTDETADLFDVLLGFLPGRDMDAKRIGRMVGFEFVFTDDDANDLLITVDTYCHSEVVLPRWVPVDKSVDRPERLTDQPWLTTQVQDYIDSWCEKNDASYETLDLSIEHQVRAALEDNTAES